MARRPIGELPPQERIFVEQYLSNGGNATAAHRFAWGGEYSENARRVQANKVMRRQRVQDAINEADERVVAKTRRVMERYAIDRTAILKELIYLGMANMGDFYDLVGSKPVLRFDKLTREQTAAIAQLTIEEYTTGAGKNARPAVRIKLRLHDKRAALTDIARMQGWLEPPAVDPTLAEPGIDQAERARVRAEFMKLLDQMARPGPLIDGDVG